MVPHKYQGGGKLLPNISKDMEACLMWVTPIIAGCSSGYENISGGGGLRCSCEPNKIERYREPYQQHVAINHGCISVIWMMVCQKGRAATDLIRIVNEEGKG